MADGTAVLIEVALNGARLQREHPSIPYTPSEVIAEARRCGDEGASLFHVHARIADGGWCADPVWYATALRGIRATVPGALVGITSIRPSDVPVSTVLDLVAKLAADPMTQPDLVSINLGQIVAWEPGPAASGSRRRTIHFPNDDDAVVAVLAACARYEIVPELGIMDLGFLSNAVALENDRVLPRPGWFLIELDSPAYGAGRQVAPSTVANYDLFAGLLREHFPDAAWAAHGADRPGYPVLLRALADGAHVRVGFEGQVRLPDGRLAGSNADLVAWAVAAARTLGRQPATTTEMRSIIGSRLAQ